MPQALHVLGVTLQKHPNRVVRHWIAASRYASAPIPRVSRTLPRDKGKQAFILFLYNPYGIAIACRLAPPATTSIAVATLELRSPKGVGACHR